ncbi:hypothetical protein [Niveispirillum fermenti]|uniref:hypothetical protein n=1 Tax=Niveispirillum fermenti TaxID=1233113 RepID=UPI003A84ACD7
MDNLFPHTGSDGGVTRRCTGLFASARQIPLNQQTIFRTIEGCDELLCILGQGSQIIR